MYMCVCVSNPRLPHHGRERPEPGVPCLGADLSLLTQDKPMISFRTYLARGVKFKVSFLKLKLFYKL